MTSAQGLHNPESGAIKAQELRNIQLASQKKNN